MPKLYLATAAPSVAALTRPLGVPSRALRGGFELTFRTDADRDDAREALARVATLVAATIGEVRVQDAPPGP